MRRSQYFLPIFRETPAEAKVASHRLMLRTGMIHQTTSGIFSWLPMGHRVMKKIEQIVREEQNAAGAQEILMPTIQPATLWEESGRGGYGKETLMIKDRHDRQMFYAPTAEEVVTDVFRQYIFSYRELPKMLYQINWKFRDEIRPRFGVLRGREFLMKDCYSFDLTEEEAAISYEKMFSAYMKTFLRMGITGLPVKADTGLIGGDLSHEFNVLADTGENEIFYDAKIDDLRKKPDDIDIKDLMSMYAASDEMHDPEKCPLKGDELRTARGIEVGHIFYLGTKYSKPMGANVTDQDGRPVTVHMGCYGIGVSRLVAAIIEAHHDENGIVWPESVAPYHVGLINLKHNDDSCVQTCDELYTKLNNLGMETLYDDRSESAGSKFADMDLIGLPWQVIIGPRGLKEGTVEIKCRRTGEKQDVSLESAVGFLQEQLKTI
ncbi:MAG: proline--tRNA ligase [Alphaproteobacteria bacterium]